MKKCDKIRTGMGEFSKEKFDALLTVRDAALDSLRGILKSYALGGHPYTEVTTSSLVNIAGSCENPDASFSVNYYGREAHLSQSSQLQLEALVMRLERPVFTVTNSFREENYDDPEAQGRRLSEFTLVEAEKCFDKSFRSEPNDALNNIAIEIERVIKYTIERVLKESDVRKAITQLGGEVSYLEEITKNPFERLSYFQALRILNSEYGLPDRAKDYQFGDDLGIREERALLRHFNNIPVLVFNHPAAIKFFNIKRFLDGKSTYGAETVYSVDLLMPPLGETVGGALREEEGKVIRRQLLDSKIAAFLRGKGLDPVAPFAEYFTLFEQEPPMLRGGYGIGFERFVGALLNSNDILETIVYRTLQP